MAESKAVKTATTTRGEKTGKAVERSSTTKGERTGKAVDDSNVEAPPTSEVLTTDEAIEKIERNSDPMGPSPRSF